MINHSKKDIVTIAVRPGFVLIPRELFTLDLSSNEFRIYVVLLTYEDRRTHMLSIVIYARESGAGHKKDSDEVCASVGSKTVA